MKVLLDTNIVLRAAGFSGRLGTELELIRDNDRLISAASAWELGIKQGVGKVDLGMPVARWVDRALTRLGAEAVPIGMADAAAVELLPPVHRDPFDRLLVAQAQRLGATLLTTDRALAAYGTFVQVV